MLLADLVAASAAVAATSSRSAKIAVLADAVGASPPELIPVVVGFLSGEPRQGKVGVGYASLFRARVPPAAAPSLTVGDLDRVIGRIPEITGPGSQQARWALLEDLLGRATADEQEFIRRLLTGEVRQGALEGVMIEAIARAASIDSGVVRRAVMLHGDLPGVAATALTEGEEAVAGIGLKVLRPVRPMLAKTGEDVAAAVAAVAPASVEWKLDGARIQAHRLDGEVRVFTRNLNDVTERVPRVVEVVAGLEVESVVLDGESMAIDDGLPRAFHETMSRFGADQPVDDVPVVPFFFDVLHLDGEDLWDRPLATRLAALDRVVPELHRVPRRVTSDPEEAAEVLEAAIERRHEGVMVKALDSTYEAGNRGGAWLKVKPVHTLDLVILAAEWGHGRRRGWLSNLHLGARDPSTGGFVMLGKTFKGLTDEMLAWQTERLLELEESRTDHVVRVRPALVAEIAFDGVVPSPRYPGGVSLRFARVKGYRPDKRPEDADSIDSVRAIFEGRT